MFLKILIMQAPSTNRRRFIVEKIFYGLFTAIFLAGLIIVYMKWNSWGWFERIIATLFEALFAPDLTELFMGYDKWLAEREEMLRNAAKLR